MEGTLFQRSNMVLGDEVMKSLSEAKVIIFGLGGVGSWCAEALIRTGLCHLTIVDFDNICETNINRQLQATSFSIGEPKVFELEKRLLQINPNAKIDAKKEYFSPETAHLFNLDTYDFIIDAIDFIECKLHLIRTATKTSAIFYSSMGAALRLDPTKIKVAEFWDVKACPFARKVRKDIRKGDLPAKEFLCVYSEEELSNVENADIPKVKPKLILHGQQQVEEVVKPKVPQGKLVNGSLVHITASYGFVLAGLVVQELHNKHRV